jgi:capsular polysaccharide biosynthesis protein
VVRLPPRLRPWFPYLKPAWVAATRVAAPVTVAASRRRGGWLPTGSVPTLAQAGAPYAPARPAETLDRPARPLGSPPGLPVTDPGDSRHVDAIGAAELPGGRVLGPHRAIVTGDGRLVDSVSRYFGTRSPREHPLYLNPSPGAPLDVDGRLGVLATRADANYYHFLMDGLPRLGVLEQSGLAAPDRWYVPCSQPFQREALALLGLTDVVDADAHPHVRAGTLVVPEPPAMSEKNPPWVVGWLRERLLPSPETTWRRLYVTRGAGAHNRSVVNEAAVLDLLGEHGFEPIDPGTLSLTAQIAAFASAQLIVAPHGAALTNLAFASPGATVIELFPAGCLLPDYWRLAAGVPGLTYRYLSAGGGPSRPTRARTIVRDIEVDLPALRSLLKEFT